MIALCADLRAGPSVCRVGTFRRERPIGGPSRAIAGVRCDSMDEVCCEIRASGRGILMRLPLLSAQGISFRYGKRVVWEDVSFDLRSGEIAILTGQNGSGKSTLLRCLAGLAEVSEGRILLSGSPFDGSRRKQRGKVVFVGDVPSFYDDLTAREHLLFLERTGGCSFDAEKAGVLAESFGIDSFLDQVPSSFSRGMRQKLALVMAFASKADVVLLDEPHAPLDPESSLTLSRWVKEAASDGSSVLMTCHYSLPGLSPDERFVLEGGRLRPTSDADRT